VSRAQVVDLFAGPGGLSEGLRILGLDDLGIELDPATCRTRTAAGHRTIRADVARLPLDPFAGRVEGLVGSPPCPLFSAAGSGLGRTLTGELAAAITDALAGQATLGRWRRVMARQLRASTLARSSLTRRAAAALAWETATEAALTAQPARWIAPLRPRWVALEQVPPVLALWRVYARQLRSLGYWTWAGILNAADYGVPQTRRRAFLLASLDRPVGPPAPTHARGGAETLFGSLAPWVSMAEALGWGRPGEPGRWVARQLRGSGISDRHGTRPDRPVTEPAPTVRANGGSNASPGFVLVKTDEVGDWMFERPATTIAGDSRCWPPGHKVNADDRRRLPDADDRYGDRAGTEAVRLSISHALILQSFRPDYPVQGTKTEQFSQVGNAVPPRLAAHVLAAVTGHALRIAA
jgi:DNA (cytosine-5)-methyltransferase 1